MSNETIDWTRYWSRYPRRDLPAYWFSLDELFPSPLLIFLGAGPPCFGTSARAEVHFSSGGIHSECRDYCSCLGFTNTQRSFEFDYDSPKCPINHHVQTSLSQLLLWLLLASTVIHWHCLGSTHTHRVWKANAYSNVLCKSSPHSFLVQFKGCKPHCMTNYLLISELKHKQHMQRL